MCCVIIGRLCAQFRLYANSCHSGSDSSDEEANGTEAGHQEEGQDDAMDEDQEDGDDSLEEDDQASAEEFEDSHGGDGLDTNVAESEDDPMTPVKPKGKVKNSSRSKSKIANRVRSRSNSSVASSSERRKKKPRKSMIPAKVKAKNLKLAPMRRGECLRN